MMSMTGFGRAAATGVRPQEPAAPGAPDSAARGPRRVVVEVRSVNHRNLDVKVRGRSLDAACEMAIIRSVRSAVSRGAVQVLVEDETETRTAGLSLDRARSAYRTLEALRAELKVEVPVSLDTVAAFLRLDRDRSTDAPLSFAEVEPALEQALEGLLAARAAEGEALATELRQRAEELGRISAALRASTAPLAERASRRLEERLQTAARSLSLDPGRLAQEAALYADRLDVTEELARLDAHRARLDELLAAPRSGVRGGPGLGRTLDFLLQELGRELNTIGSKSQDSDVAALVIAGKAELEKIREQAQNIE